jgi:O-succinylbenzoate synthase
MADVLRIDGIGIERVVMPLKAPFETSFGVERERAFWLVTVEGGGLTGYAESVAGDEPYYNEETNDTVRHMIRDHLGPRLLGQPIEHPDEVLPLFAQVRGNRMAKAALEMAVWDLYGRVRNAPISALLGGARDRVPVGVSIGIQATPADLVTQATRFFAAGYRRLKIKIRPGLDLEPLRAVRRALPDAPMMADANSAYSLEAVSVFQEMDALDLLMIEQPLAEDDLVDHAELQALIKTPVCLDESIRTQDDAQKAFRIGACRVINIKLGRVGGFSEARRIHDVARAQGYPVWCGGMLESGIGRAANLHITTLPGFTLPGDTSGSDRYWEEDLVDPPFVLEPDGTMAVPRGPGLGVVPDPRRLKRYGGVHEHFVK